MADMDANKYRKRIRLFQYVVIGVNTLLRRWTAESADAVGKLRASDAVIDEVVKETATAVVQIGGGFRTILDKTHRQTTLATGLLKSHDRAPTSDANAGDNAATPREAPGLQDFVKLYEHQLQRVAAELERYSVLAEEMVAHQKQVRIDAAAMDDTLDELHNMSARIARISLDASIAATNQEFDSKTFIEMTDRVRAISEQSHDLTRRARKGLESIREEVMLATKHTMSAAISARGAANIAALEIQKLNGGMLEMGNEIESTTHDINVLGGEIQREIHQLIVAMQFQDRIQQKLDKLRANHLNAVIQTLDSLGHETSALTRRELYQQVLDYSERSLPPGPQDWNVAPVEAGDDNTRTTTDAGKAKASTVGVLDGTSKSRGREDGEEAGNAEIF